MELKTHSSEHRCVSFEYKFVGEAAGAFEGYGAVFNNEDDGGDLIQPGAFTKTLQEYQARGKMPKMLLNHGSAGSGFFGASDPMADVPIGKWTSMSEDTHGLNVKGQLINLDTERGKTIHGAMKEGELDALSIGYKATNFIRGSKENEPRRTIKEIKLYEVSPVTFPMNNLAVINAVKGAGIKTVREFEAFLRDVGGFSHTAARSIAIHGFKSSDPRDEAAATLKRQTLGEISRTLKDFQLPTL